MAEEKLARRNAVRRDAWLSANRSTLNLLHIPLHALLLAFLFRKHAKRLYIEHLNFALTLAGFAYFALAMRTVY